jgi:protein-glutamine gamma-glutamyltransferase
MRLPWRRLKSLNPLMAEPPEGSWLLRVLAQSMVVVGILATDMAAETMMGLWAVPASLAGATWSWSNRHNRNITVKFLLAIGMMVALIAFFSRLLVGRELNDTRLALAELLIQVQVLHSFDMPRRKDLGYSMMIGLILMGVACTLSQTMGFGLFLLLFLAIALPVLVMDYRSRLGLINQWQGVKAGTGSPNAKKTGREFAAGFGLILLLGLGIFALMPRLPGYQVQTFPVSAPIETQGKFDQTQITNPGYIGQGRGNGNGSGSRGNTPAKGPGQADPTFYSGFANQMNQNLRGQLKEQVVMRVRSQAPGFWRVMAFDRYTGQGWEISKNDQTKTITRSPWSYQFFHTQRIRLNRTKSVVQTYTMVSELPNVIPALDQVRELYFPTQEIAVDHEDGFRSPTVLSEGLTYTVVSDVPYRDRAKLKTAVSRLLLDRSNKPNAYTEVPPSLQPKLKQLAESFLAQANSPITSDYEKALYITQALKQRYKIQSDIPFLGEREDLVESFLFKTKGGYPDHFSTTLTLMLRSIGLTTRLVTGFSPGQFNPFTGYYVVKNTDAYAMTEVYMHKYGWVTFDPIPGHPLLPPSLEESQTFSVLQQFWRWVASWLPSPVSGWLAWAFGGLLSLVMGAIGRLLGLFQQGGLGWLWGILILMAIAFGSWLLWQGWQQWRYWYRLRRRHPVDRLYQQLIDWLAARGLPKHDAQTPGEYAHSLQAKTSIELQTLLSQMTAAYLAWRYGGVTPDVAPLARSFQQLQQRQHWQLFQTAIRDRRWFKRS